jgi:hypothetical protein
MVRTMREQARRSRAGARLPSSPGAPSDPAAATGSPWPRLTAAPGAGTARRLRRWVIVAGIVLLAGSITATVTGRTLSPPAPRPAAGYLLVAHDAHFTALFPRKPLRMEKTAGTTTIIVYLADLPGYAVGIICAPVPASGLVKLDRAINVAASALPGGDVVSRHRLTYHGQPAEDAAISVLGEPGQIRVVVFGSSAYIFEGLGATASFAHDYQILLDTFTPHPSGGTTGQSATATAPQPGTQRP